MTEKYSLLPAQSQLLTPVQTASHQLSEKHPYFEIQPVNTIRPLEIEYTQRPCTIPFPVMYCALTIFWP